MQLHWFKLKFHGHCALCHGPLTGMLGAYDDNHRIIGECCRDVEPPTPEDDYKARERVIDVMPRGKSARDACLRCFQVPSSSGVCGCEDDSLGPRSMPYTPRPCRG